MTKKELDAATEGRKASVLGPGDSMGESALVIDSERSATIKVTERSIFYALEKRHFSAFLQVAPKLQDTIMLHTKERLLSVYRQRKVPFFAELSDAKLKQAAWTASLQQFNDGDVICKKDDAGKAFYVVVSGRVDVEDVGSLKSGSYFGEISMLPQGQPVTATCTAKARTSLLALERTGFVELMMSEPELGAYMRMKILRQRATLHDVLTHHKSRKIFGEFIAAEYADESLKFYDEIETYKATAEKLLSKKPSVMVEISTKSAETPATDDKPAPGLLGIFSKREGPPAPSEPKKEEPATSSPQEELYAAAKALCDEYIREGSNQQINIPNNCRINTLKCLDDKRIDAGTFDDARQEVYTLMGRDTLPRFVQAAPYNELLAFFGSYEMDTVGGGGLDLETLLAA